MTLDESSPYEIEYEEPSPYVHDLTASNDFLQSVIGVKEQEYKDLKNNYLRLRVLARTSLNYFGFKPLNPETAKAFEIVRVSLEHELQSLKDIL